LILAGMLTTGLDFYTLPFFRNIHYGNRKDSAAGLVSQSEMQHALIAQPVIFELRLALSSAVWVVLSVRGPAVYEEKLTLS
jgi:hypothetical protein